MILSHPSSLSSLEVFILRERSRNFNWESNENWSIVWNELIKVIETCVETHIFQKGKFFHSLLSFLQLEFSSRFISFLYLLLDNSFSQNNSFFWKLEDCSNFPSFDVRNCIRKLVSKSRSQKLYSKISIVSLDVDSFLHDPFSFRDL